MVAVSPYVAAAASLSSTSGNAGCGLAPEHTVFVTVYPSANPASSAVAVTAVGGVSYPSASLSPKPVGGPYDNPYNNVPLPYHWPGRPSPGQTTAPDKPYPPFPYGGAAKNQYWSPAWIPKGQNQLQGSSPNGKQNGNSNWGELNCPHLPVSGLPGGPSYSSLPTKGASSTTPSHGAPYPTSSTSVHGSLTYVTTGSTTYIHSGTSTYSTIVVSSSGFTSYSNGTSSTGTGYSTRGTAVSSSGNRTSSGTGYSTSGSAVSSSAKASTVSSYGSITSSALSSTGFPISTANATTTKASSGFPSSSANGTITASASLSASVTGKANSTTTTSSNSTVPACPTMPDTGVTRTYDLDVAYQTIAPDGVTRNGLTINGQFPGPLVEANWGDWILLRVTNSLNNEGTSIHCHGLLQTGTPWYDGVPAIAQCPLTPNGGSLDMLFRADQYGTSWYHSHYSAQYSGGAHGPLVIYGPKHADYDIDIGPVLLEDWFHADYFTLVNDTMFGNFPPSNNNLINGKMQYPCANTTLPCSPNAGISKFQFEAGKKHLLRLINAGAEGVQKFSIDDHTLTVVAQDFVPIQPYDTNVVTLGIGQRADVIVEAKATNGSAFWMRSQLGTNRCTLNDGISPNAVAAVYYNGADTTSVPDTTSDVTADQLAFCKNDPLDQTVPLCSIPLQTPTLTETIDIDYQSNGTFFVWTMNNSSFRGDYNDPILLKVKQGDLNFKPEWNVMNFGNASTVRIKLVNHGLLGGHPMHLHGHDFSVLAEGFGDWDGTITNPSNPARRDVHILQNAQDPNTPSYMVLQYNQDNPGAWPLHCHLAWHVSGGLFVTALERPDDIAKETFDEDLFSGCNAWDAYTSGNIVDQIDSGL